MTKPKAPKPKPRAKAKGGASQQSAQLRRRAFAEAYLSNSRNATQAAITAGLSPKSAGSAGERMLKHVEVQAILQVREREILAKLEISTERTLRERARLAYYDIGDLACAGIKSPDDIARLPVDIRQAVTGWKWDKDGRFMLQFADKNPHLTALERHQGLYRADNEQLKPDAVDPSRLDRIEAARAIAFVLAKASRLKKAKGKKPA